MMLLAAKNLVLKRTLRRLFAGVIAGLMGCSSDSVPSDGIGAIGISAVTKTGQSVCYDTAGLAVNCLLASGQDGALQVGAAWPVPRFRLNADTTTTDVLTGLDWAPDANVMPGRDPGWDNDAMVDDGLVRWQLALNYIAKLNNEAYLGYNDWRLPDRNELRSLVHYGQSSLATWLGAQSFVNVAAAPYWTSTTLHNVAAQAWAVNMQDGYVLALPKTDVGYYSHVWPVRDSRFSASIRLARTGQTTCYNDVGSAINCDNTGQDADLQKGVRWITTRFTTNVGGSKKDRLTTLSWTPHGNLLFNRDPAFDTDGNEDGYVNWQLALQYIAKLNNEQYLGQSDWRMPNALEMQSLIHAGDNTSSWLSRIGFVSVQTNYWTSTTRSATPGYAWLMNLMSGMPAVIKTSYYPVWPVRGGT